LDRQQAGCHKDRLAGFREGIEGFVVQSNGLKR
jgi:hypothetical protein